MQRAGTAVRRRKQAARNGPSGVGARIRDRRAQLGWTQADVAKKIGCRPNYVGYLEAGARRPSMKVVERLARVLDLDAGVLLAGWFPLVARVQEQAGAPPTGDAWELFRADKGLLTRNAVSPAELAALEAASKHCGPFAAPRDYLFVLEAIRRARAES